MLEIAAAEADLLAAPKRTRTHRSRKQSAGPPAWTRSPGAVQTRLLKIVVQLSCQILAGELVRVFLAENRGITAEQVAG